MDLQREALRSLDVQNAGSLRVASQQCEQGQPTSGVPASLAEGRGERFSQEGVSCFYL